MGTIHDLRSRRATREAQERHPARPGVFLDGDRLDLVIAALGITSGHSEVPAADRLEAARLAEELAEHLPAGR